MQAIGWRVFLNGRHIDMVWFTGYNAEEAKRSLIEHDGYDPRIEVRAPKRPGRDASAIGSIQSPSETRRRRTRLAQKGTSGYVRFSRL